MTRSVMYYFNRCTRRLASILVQIASLMCCALFATATSAEVLPSGTDLIDRSNAAMNAPISFCITSEGTVTTVTRKRMPSGAVYMRAETSSPVKKISFDLGSESYEAYPDFGVMIDTTIVNSALKSHLPGAFKDVLGRNDVSPTTVGSVSRDGKLCYWVELTIPDGLSVNPLLLDSKSVNASKAPHISRLWIQKDTFELVATEMISKSGDRITACQYSDVEHPAEIPDSLFVPPNGLETKRPASMAECLALQQEMFRRDVQSVRRTSLDRAKQVELEMIEQFRQRVRDAQKAVRDEVQAEIENGPSSITRTTLHLGPARPYQRILIYANAGLIVALLGAIYLRHVRRAKSSN